MSLNMKFICARFTEHFLPKTNKSHIDRHDEISSFNYRKSDQKLIPLSLYIHCNANLIFSYCQVVHME